MPILPREPDLFPEDLLDSVRPFHPEAPARWWGLYTLSKKEKALMRSLRALEIPHYGPLISRRYRSPSGRMRESFVPLFPNYVFIYGDDEQRRVALTTNYVSRCLTVPDDDLLTADLRRVQQLVATGAPLTPEARLEAGEEVRVKSGPFKGLEGVVIHRRGQQRLVVSVQFLQQGVSVLLEDVSLERISL